MASGRRTSGTILPLYFAPSLSKISQNATNKSVKHEPSESSSVTTTTKRTHNIQFPRYYVKQVQQPPSSTTVKVEETLTKCVGREPCPVGNYPQVRTPDVSQVGKRSISVLGERCETPKPSSSFALRNDIGLLPIKKEPQENQPNVHGGSYVDQFRPDHFSTSMSLGVSDSFGRMPVTPPAPSSEKIANPLYKSVKKSTVAKKSCGGILAWKINSFVPEESVSNSQAVLKSNEPLKKTTKKIKVETVTREESTEREGVVAIMSSSMTPARMKTRSQRSAPKTWIEKGPDNTFFTPDLTGSTVRQSNLELIPPTDEIEEADVALTETAIRMEGEVLQRLVNRNRRDLQEVMKTETPNVFPQTANKKFYENLFPKKWERLMVPLLHLVSAKECQICNKTFYSTEESKVHYYTKMHVQNHLEKIEMESVCEHFLPYRWRNELCLEPDQIQDYPEDKNFPW